MKKITIRLIGFMMALFIVAGIICPVNVFAESGMTVGDTTVGGMTVGDTTDGGMTVGDTTDGDMTVGDTTDGDMTDGTGIQKQVQETLDHAEDETKAVTDSDVSDDNMADDNVADEELSIEADDEGKDIFGAGDAGIITWKRGSRQDGISYLYTSSFTGNTAICMDHFLAGANPSSGREEIPVNASYITDGGLKRLFYYTMVMHPDRYIFPEGIRGEMNLHIAVCILGDEAKVKADELYTGLSPANKKDVDNLVSIARTGKDPETGKEISRNITLVLLSPAIEGESKWQSYISYRLNPEGNYSFSIKKKSAEPLFTDDRSAYSLKGTRYGLYMTEDAAKETKDAKGYFDVAEDGSSAAVDVTALMKRDSNDVLQDTLFYVRELTAGKGYTLDTSVHKAVVHVNDRNTVVLDVTDVPVKGGISFIKKEIGTDRELGGIGFKISSKETNEIWDVVTDDTGKASTGEVLPLGNYTLSELPGDANEELQLIQDIDFAVDKQGTVSLGIKDGEDGVIYDAPKPFIKTLAEVEGTGSKFAPQSGIVTIADKVSYSFLKAGTGFTLKGYLMVKSEDGQSVENVMQDGKTVTAVTTFKTSDKYEKSVYEVCGTETVKFENLDLSAYAGKELVVFEELYIGTEDDIENPVTHYPDSDSGALFPIEHKDISDTDQTIYVPLLSTTAGPKDKDKGITKDNISFIDTVVYTNLKPDTDFTIVGTVYDRETGEKLMLGGAEVTSKRELHTGSDENGLKSAGEIVVEFDIDSKYYDEIAGKTLVCFERCYDSDGNLMALHEDIDYVGQSVNIPEKEKPPVKPTPPKSETPKPKPSPKTGDGTPVAAAAAVMCLAVAGAMMVLMFKSRGRDLAQDQGN
ncbi:MAG: VaFE repeat-containing surface-anchored protein [Eubacterium sp.]|nr:VaFE repeat-containing surface-anchored protein [Eubacterium sp.]